MKQEQVYKDGAEQSHLIQQKGGSAQQKTDYLDGASNLILSLIYGKTMEYYNTYFGWNSTCILYFHQSNQEILVALDKDTLQQVVYLQIRKLNMCVNKGFKFQNSYFTNHYQYILVQDQSDELVLLFEKDKQKKKQKQMLSFYSIAKQMIIRMNSKPSLIDANVIKCFLKTDINKNSIIQFSQLERLLYKLKIRNRQKINQFIQIARQQIKFSNITFNDFERTIKICMCRKQLIPIFAKYSKTNIKSYQQYSKSIMSKQNFEEFLAKQQKQSEQTIKNITSEIFKQPTAKLSFYQFCMFILGSQNDIQPKQYRKKSVNTKLPLNQYYCHSSHQTYISGQTIVSAQRFFEDLEAGIRYLQICCYDNDNVKSYKADDRQLKDDILDYILDEEEREKLRSRKAYLRKYQPIIIHQNQNILFQSAIQAIAKFINMQKSRHTPIIISISNYCGNQFQLAVAYILRIYFKNNIYILSEDYNQASPTLPTLQWLYGKVVIKNTGAFSIYKEIIIDEKLDKLQDIQKGQDQIQKQKECESGKLFFQGEKLCLIIKKDANQNSGDLQCLHSQLLSQKMEKLRKESNEVKSLQLRPKLHLLSSVNNVFLNQKQSEEFAAKQDTELQIQQPFILESQSNIPKNYLKKKQTFDAKVSHLKSQKEKFVSKADQIFHFSKKYAKKKNVKTIKNLVNIYFLKLVSIFSSGVSCNSSPFQCLTFTQDKVAQFYLKDPNAVVQQSLKGWVKSEPIQGNDYHKNPLPCIQLGIQIIAQNTQIVDHNTLVLRKFFQKGSQNVIGYRQKIYKELQISRNYSLHKPQDRQLTTVKVTPISALKIAYNLYEQVPVVQVRMRLYCYSGDKKLNQSNQEWKQYTQEVKDNAFNPVFNHRKTMNIKYSEQQLTYIIFEIKQAGIGIIPMQGIKSGYRVASMYNHKGKVKSSKVLFHVEKQESKS